MLRTPCEQGLFRRELSLSQEQPFTPAQNYSPELLQERNYCTRKDDLSFASLSRVQDESFRGYSSTPV